MHTNRPSPFLNRTPLTGTAREAFLARIRKNLDHPTNRSPDPGTPPFLDPAILRQVPPTPPGSPPSSAVIDRWQQKMTENKATVHRLPAPPAADPAPLLAALDACLAKHTIKKALLNLQSLTLPPTQDSGLRTQDSALSTSIASYLHSKQIQTTEWPSETAFLDAFQADVAITDAPAGLADTGALLVWSHATFGRSSTLVTPIHITLLPTSRILPDLVDGLAFVQAEYAKRGGGLPSNIVVINGPSKTGDIEMKLVVGVHGPKYLYILLLDNL